MSILIFIPASVVWHRISMQRTHSTGGSTVRGRWRRGGGIGGGAKQLESLVAAMRCERVRVSEPSPHSSSHTQRTANGTSGRGQKSRKVRLKTRLTRVRRVGSVLPEACGTDRPLKKRETASRKLCSEAEGGERR